ncbi:MAG: potassium channel family protein [Nocardioidaceae bacterium]
MKGRDRQVDYALLEARERRRLAGGMLLRAAAVALAAIAGYFWLPMSGWTDLALLAQLTIGGVAIVALLAWQIRDIARSPYPQVRAVGAVTTFLTIFILGFATCYYLLSEADQASWTEPLSRLDAVYLTVTVFATVGFGDIAAVDQSARGVVTGQMIADLVIVGLVIRMVTRAVDRGMRRRQHDIPPVETGSPTESAAHSSAEEKER